MRSLFLTGLKKQTGKTIIAAGLTATMQSLSYSTGYFKTIQTGSILKYDSEDVQFIKSVDPNINTYSAYNLQSSLSPLAGSYQTDIKKINIHKIIEDYNSFNHLSEFNIIEGSNSISAPIDETHTEIDIVKALRIPLILIVNAQKSSIDEIISTVSYIKANKISSFGIIINEYNIESNNIEQKYIPHLIKEYTLNTKIFGCFPHLDEVSPNALIAKTLGIFNLEEFFGLKISKLH